MALARYFRVDCGEHPEDARQYATDILKDVPEARQLQRAVKTAQLGADVLDLLTVYWEVADLPPEVQAEFAARDALNGIAEQRA
jgi:hypothetical protein